MFINSSDIKERHMNVYDEDYYYGTRKSNYSNYERLDASKKFKMFLDFIAEERITGRFLDVGCAFGFLLEEAAHFFDEVIGCDISEFAIEKARRRYPDLDFDVVDVQEPMPYPDESFDCIAAMDVLEHTDSFEDSFQNLTVKLRRGGYLMLSTPLDSWVRKIFGVFDRDETHVSIPDEETLRSIIRRNDLAVLKAAKYAPTPGRKKIPYVPAQIELILRKPE